ncbi:FAMILY 61 PROTEIN putative-RELATED [Salix viminalis]|uniref:FAMILY 61 PROTEIN putative-RELATED n=1 Tax=Salix viminalis TaxID=40686 RepID=A0A9Q0NW81_SALVM|nr:FAMILY 61 PROTEIN putative-RELATED [Salix viminalis]
MKYQTLLARSFSKHEQKKLGYWALLACLFIALSFFINFKPFMGPLSVLNLRLSTGEDEKLHLFDDTDSSLQIAKETINSTSIVNDTGSSHEEAEIMSSALTVNDTDSSHGESEIREIIVNNATSRSQEVVVFKESLAQNMKTNDSSNPPQFVNEKDTFHGQQYEQLSSRSNRCECWNEEQHSRAASMHFHGQIRFLRDKRGHQD